MELADPRAGEVLVRLEACGVCHTDMYTASGADPSGYAPAVLGHEGCGMVETRGRGRHAREGGRPRGHAVLAPVRRVRALPQPQDQPLHRHPRGAEPGPSARRNRAAQPRRRGNTPFHGHLHLRGVHRDARDRAGGDQPRRPARARCPVRLRAIHRPGRGDQHRKGGARLDLRGVRRGPGRAGRRGGLPPAGRRADRVRRPLRRPAGAGSRAGRHRCPEGWPGSRGRDPRDDRRHGRRLHLRGHRQREA